MDGAGLSDGLLGILNNRAAEFIDYVNNQGGGVLAMAQDPAEVPYGYLGGYSVNKVGNNTMTATTDAPAQWANFGIDDHVTPSSLGLLNHGTPYRATFHGPTGYNRLLPLAVDPITGEPAMLGTHPGAGPGIGAPRRVWWLRPTGEPCGWTPCRTTATWRSSTS